MPSPPDPPGNANPFIEAAQNAGINLPVKRLAGAGGVGKLRKLVGFLDAPPQAGQPRRLYFDDALDCGVDIPVNAIKYWSELPPRRKDGLKRDAVWVTHDADLLYFSRTPPGRDDPSDGGGGFPAGPPW